MFNAISIHPWFITIQIEYLPEKADYLLVVEYIEA